MKKPTATPGKTYTLSQLGDLLGWTPDSPQVLRDQLATLRGVEFVDAAAVRKAVFEKGGEPC